MDTTSFFGISPALAAVVYQLATIVALVICIGGVLRHLLPLPLTNNDPARGVKAFILKHPGYDVFFACLIICSAWSRWAQVMVNPTAHEGFSGFFKALSDTRKQLDKESAKGLPEEPTSLKVEPITEIKKEPIKLLTYDPNFVPPHKK